MDSTPPVLKDRSTRGTIRLGCHARLWAQQPCMGAAMRSWQPMPYLQSREPSIHQPGYRRCRGDPHRAGRHPALALRLLPRQAIQRQ
jgi:hypothetical protein